ncbi:hypothetical protein N9N67_01170 [Bacteriovoracaceae bacterium]|nr:hypothetical protein [Bacteriovoracaceae bacterium]
MKFLFLTFFTFGFIFSEARGKSISCAKTPGLGLTHTFEMEEFPFGPELVTAKLSKTARVILVENTFAGQKIDQNKYQLFSNDGNQFEFVLFNKYYEAPYCPPHSRVPCKMKKILMGKLSTQGKDDVYFNCGSL